MIKNDKKIAKQEKLIKEAGLGDSKNKKIKFW